MIADPTHRSTRARSHQAYTGTDGGSRGTQGARPGRTSSGVFALGLALGPALGCGDAELAPPPSPPPPVVEAEVGRVPLTPSCVDGAVEPCHEMLGEHDGIVSCYEGTRTCVNGAYGACLDGESYQVMRGVGESAEATGINLRPLAFSSATECTNNPCNSYCREFN